MLTGGSPDAEDWSNAIAITGTNHFLKYIQTELYLFELYFIYFNQIKSFEWYDHNLLENLVL